METSLKLFPLNALISVDGDTELEKLTKQNTISNRNIPILNSDLEADARTFKRLVSKKPRVRFSESCTIIPSAFDVSTYTFRKIRAATPFYTPTRPLVRPHSEEEHNPRQAHLSRLSTTLSEAELYVSRMQDTRNTDSTKHTDTQVDLKNENTDSDKEK